MSYSSHWEEDYARHLDTLKLAGEIADYRYEPWRFQLADKCTYLPDFLVVPKDPAKPLELHEVKGFMREDSIVKFKVAAAKFPFMVFIMIKKEKKCWEEIMRFNDGLRTALPKPLPKPREEIKKAVPVKRAGAIMTPRTMSYNEMLNNPEYNRILKLTPEALKKLRGERSATEMASLIGMQPTAWRKLESGATKLYHFRYVEAIRKLMEEK